MEYLKGSYGKSLKVFAILNILFFWVLLFSGGGLSDLSTLMSSLTLENTGFALIAPIGVFVLDGVISADMKARLIHWRFLNPLPGSRAFSEHLVKEPRADPERLIQQWGEFPSEPLEQNRMWYKIYKSVEEEPEVREAHRNSLQSRDLASFAFIFLISFGAASFFVADSSSSRFAFQIFLIVQYLLLAVSARNYGVRFVRNVMAIASLFNN